MEARKIDLSNGFKLVIKNTKADHKGDTIAIIIKYLDVTVNKNSSVRYDDVVRGINDITENFIPTYLKEHKIININFLTNRGVIKNFVIAYLDKHKVYYGATINVLTALNKGGYTVPTNNDSLTVTELNKFYSTVDRLSNEFKKQLCSFGYNADRRTTDQSLHETWPRHPRCRNLVYVRYPWTGTYRIGKVINKFISDSTPVVGDLTKFKTTEAKLHKKMTAVESKLDTIRDDISKSVSDHKFYDTFGDFETLVETERERLIKKWSKRLAPRYGKYNK